MADFSGIGAFGAGAVQGYDAGLSRYATIEDMRRRREAEQRAAQAQALQGLLTSAQLSAQHPDVAEAAMRVPGQEILPIEATTAGVARARALQGAGARFFQGVQTGDLDINDPEIGRFVASDPAKYMPMVTEALAKRRMREIIADPNLTPQQKQQALISAGVIKPDAANMGMAYPALPAGVKSAETGAVLGAELQPGPGGTPAIGERAGAIAGSEARAKSDVTLEPAPATTLYGRRGVSRGQAETTERELGQTTGNVMGRMMPIPGSMKPELSGERALAEARETPAQRAWLRTRTEDVKVTPSDESNKRLWDQLLATGYAYDKTTGRMYGPQDIPLLGQKLGKKGQAPREINGVLVFNPRPFSQAMSAQDRLQLAQEQTRQWLGKEAIIGVDEAGQPIRKRVTKEDMLNYYKRQLGAPQ